MPPIRVTVKWRGKKFEDIEVDPTEPALLFKTQLYTLTGVEPARQKIMIKGGTLKDDTDVSKLGWKDGQTLMMMGTTEEVPQPSLAPIVFMEDMTEEELNVALELPSGLTNLGNTCYMNATLQCLRMIPELQNSLNDFKAGITSIDERGNLAASLRNLYQELSNSGSAVAPFVFLNMLQRTFPEFARTNSQGHPMQHDAEECWSQLISVLKDKIPASGGSDASVEQSFVDRYMTAECETVTRLLENPDLEPEVVERELYQKLDCHINVDTNHMITGIKRPMTDTLSKNSPSLGCSAIYQKHTKIARLPQYLVVHFIRFFWKSSENIRAKIMRRVKFPFELDATELCTPELQQRMSKAKAKLHEMEKQRESKMQEAKRRMNVTDVGTSAELPPRADSNDTEKNKNMDTEEGDKVDWLEVLDPELAKDVGGNPTGQYELAAVLTHRGASADSGHYIGWVKKDDSEDEWIKYDDDKVSIIKESDITKLEGGGEWHTAYILLYRAKKLL